MSFKNGRFTKIFIINLFLAILIAAVLLSFKYFLKFASRSPDNFDKREVRFGNNEVQVDIHNDWQARSTSSQQIFSMFVKDYPEIEMYISIYDNISRSTLKEWFDSKFKVTTMEEQTRSGLQWAEYIDGQEVLFVTGAHLPAISDSLHMYRAQEAVIIETSLWPYPPSKNPIKTTSEFYLMSLSVDLI